MKYGNLLEQSKSVCLALGGLASLALFSLPVVGASDDDDYWRVVSVRAQKIVDQIDIEKKAVADRVADIIARQYVDLNTIHETRDANISAVKSGANGSGDQSSDQVELIRLRADVAVAQLHAGFIGRLSAELNPDQIVDVKDGLTYGVVKLTYGRYMELLPDIGEEQRRFIYAALVEARERAMDAGSAKAKHYQFNIAKGKINNYLSRLGIDMKSAEQALAEREKAALR